MKLKLDENGSAVVENGMPVYIHDDGKEAAFDAAGAVQAIASRNAEAKSHREAKETAEKQLKAFEGISDPAAALDAMNKIKSIDDKALFDAGKVEEIKAATIKAIEEKYQPVVQQNEALQKELHSEKIGGSFSRSKFIAEKMAVPVEMAEAYFGKHFALEEGKMVAKDGDGNPIYSKTNPGQSAGFDEALQFLVEKSPFRDNVLKGLNHDGSSAPGGGDTSSGSQKTMTRSDFNDLPHVDRSAKIKEGYQVVDAT